jgi:hypothetical protein
MLPIGNCSYEIRRDGQLVAVEDSRWEGSAIVASRRSADGFSRHNLEAVVDSNGRVERVALSYSSNLFTRKASYEAAEDHLRGRISGLAGNNEIVVQMGRFREVDAAGFVIFRALIIAHVQSRAVDRWTGRVAVIEPNTLAAASLKQSCAKRSNSEFSWIYEPRMGDTEQIEVDQSGRIITRRDNRGTTVQLIAADRAG